MPQYQTRPSGGHKVTALFEDGAVSYAIADGTTVEQISRQIAFLADQQRSWPISISVHFTAPNCLGASQ